jgi:hypothetical protein
MEPRMTTQDEAKTGETSGRRQVTPVTSLDTIVGAHPEALEKIYRNAKPADPAELGDAPSGRLLSISSASEVFMLTRPLVQALASFRAGWRGKTFDHGGNSGQNVVFGKKVFRFRTEMAESVVDGRPTLKLSYADPNFKNPWLVRAVFDELRGVGPGVAIGPVVSTSSGKVLGWFGLELAR